LGELKGLGVVVSATTVRNVLIEAGVSCAGARGVVVAGVLAPAGGDDLGVRLSDR